jgi:hypothetical protein
VTQPDGRNTPPFEVARELTRSGSRGLFGATTAHPAVGAT